MKKIFLVMFLFLFVLLAWSPWLTKEFAENTARNVFESGQSGIIDGCGFSCDGCGVESSQKIPFGYLVNIKYKCGMCGPDCHFRGEKGFVTPFGISFPVSRY